MDQDIEINGDVYRMSDLFIHKGNRRQTNFNIDRRNNLSHSVKKMGDEITLFTKKSTEQRMEERKNEVFAKIIQSSNENSQI